MSRIAILLIAGAAACAGPKKQPDRPILPPDPTQAKLEPTPAAKPAEPVVEKPPAPMKPADVALPLGETTVKLLSGGKGAKAKLAFAPAANAKQHVAVAMDFHAKQDGKDDISPTIILDGDAATRPGAAGGGAIDYALAITAATAKDVTGSELPADKLQPALVSLVGMTMGGTVAANGTSKELVLHIEKPDGMTGSALQLVGLAWPALAAFPAEAVGVGAKWEATTQTHLAEKLAVTRVTTYEVTAHKGKAWTLKQTVVVTGADQDLDGAKASKIAGSGTGELVYTDGAIFPAGTVKGETHFSVLAGDKTVVLSIETAAAITTK